MTRASRRRSDGHPAAQPDGECPRPPVPGPRDEGSFTLTGDTLTLSGIAATPAEDTAARAALDAPGAFETVVAIDVTGPGTVDFDLGYGAETGFALDGILPEGLSPDAIAAALGAEVSAGEIATTFAALPGVETALTGLKGALGRVETLTLNIGNDGISAKAVAMAGVDPEAVAMTLGKALGPEVGLSVTAAATPPEDGTERVVAATGAVQRAFGGGWITMPDFEPSRALCTERAMARVTQTPIQFVTASAELDPAALAVLNDLAGILLICTRGAGMIVKVGGHTDAEGDDAANYVLSAARARAVRDALAARGVKAGRMIAIGYGETEPVADNETEEGRAQNRRTTFAWPG